MKFADTVQMTYLANETTGANTVLRPGNGGTSFLKP